MNLRHRGEANSFSLVRIRSRKESFVAGSRSIGYTSGTAGARPSLLCVIALGAFFGMAGCSTNAARSVSQTPLISVAISQAVPSSLTVGSTMQVSATVSNDLATAGVDWVASCASAPNCGSFSPAHTYSGGTTVYTAPLAVPAKKTVAVTALSATDHSKASVTSVTIISTVTAVTITQPPPASAPSGALVSFAATVDGDPSNSGVDWKMTCTTINGPVDCTPGGFHSASGAPTPSFVVPGPLQIPFIVGGTVTVTAFATADHSFSSQAAFTVTAPITVSLIQVPPNTMLVNATATVAATVSNDSTNSGVDWLVVCSNLPCGSVSPSHTASGVPATFTAPPTAPAAGLGFGPGGVTITATVSATGGPSVVTATANVTIVVPISIKLNQGVPNNTIVQNHTANLVATVSGDATNAGVDWAVTCGTVGNCGSFSPAHTASASPTTFTAPSAIPAGGSVTITATSTIDPTKTATETDTVTASPPPNSLLLGQFVMLLTAKNSTPNGSYAVGGVISGDGNGNITAATFDLADASGNAAASVNVKSPSTYSIGPDGRGQIHLLINTGALSSGFGVNGTGALTLSVVFVTPQHALLTEVDSFGNGTGTLDLQNLQGFPGLRGAYSLRLSGYEVSRAGAPYFVASGVSIPSSSSYSYITDQSDDGAITSVPFATVPSAFVNAGVDQNGELRLGSVNLGLPTLFNLDLWVIDATHLALTDWRDSAFGSPPVIIGGYMTAQPPSPGVSGPYAFTEVGATAAAQPQVAGGIFTCGSTGTLDVAPLGGTLTTNQAITAACTAPTSGRSLITLSGAGSTGVSRFAAYPTLDQGLYLIELDGGSTGASGPSGAGVALQQTLPAPILASAFSGSYASNFLANTTQGAESFAAKIVSDGNSTLSGVADANTFNATAVPPGTPSFGATLTGSFTAGANGRFPLTLTITPAIGQPTPSLAAINPACYIIDANTCLLLGLDATAPGTGILLFQRTGL
jgi:hypothetical protein